MEYAKFEKVWIKTHPELNEGWVQDRIAEDPSILGLGDIILKDKERNQPKAGRLDLLFQEADANSRYEVEIQLGSSDESHIIRTIEYWDIERKRYPQYEHTAVIVAEDITSRYLNVISLFNGMIPIIAIQMNALKIDNRIGLIFTTVLDQMRLGLIDEDEEVLEITNREYWEHRGTKKSVQMADSLLAIAKEFEPILELKYNKFYIGIAQNGVANNFFLMKPKKSFLRIEIKLRKTQEINDTMENAGLDVMDYNVRDGRYRIRLNPGDIEKQKDILSEIIKQAWEENKE
jgi:hypothetical protein